MSNLSVPWPLGENKLAKLRRHTSRVLLRVEKVWAHLTSPGDQLSHQIGYPQFGDFVGKHVGHHVGLLVHLHVGHHVYLHVGHHVSHHVGHCVSQHVGHGNVFSTLCEVSETLTEWKSETMTYGRTD